MNEKQMPVEENNDIDINADSNLPGNTHLSNPDSEILQETEKLQMELKEQKDKYLRLSAEFDNFRRRTAKERIELIQTAGKETIFSLLEILDDSERAEKQMQASDDIAVIKEGTLLVFNKFRNVLLQKGLKAMESIGEDFDVEKHEAITEVPAPEKMKGKVVDEVVKGYYLNDKLIRFAKVVVGK
ncbi:MAG: nucleotide exchange factor GrpE [Ferruginibacter sp.]